MQKHHGEPDDEAQPYKIGNAEELSLNLLRLFEQGGRVLTEFIERADSKSGPYSAAAEITEATNTLSDLAQHWFADPTALAEAQGTLVRSYADLWNPELAAAGHIGVIDIQYQTTIESAAMINGGSLNNYEPGKAKLLELKKMGVKIYPTNEAMAQALKTEECWMCIMWKARGVMWQNAGIPVEIANPKEGIVLYVSELAIAKNAKNKDAAYAYLNAMLEPQPQQEFAKNMGYNPTASNSGLPADMAARIGFDKAIEERFMVQDQEYLAQNDPQLQEWWNKVFKT